MSSLSVFPVRSRDGDHPLIEPDSALADAPPLSAFANKAQPLHHSAGAIIPDEGVAEDTLGSALAESLVDHCADRFGRVALSVRINGEGVANVENGGVPFDWAQAHATNVSS